MRLMAATFAVAALLLSACGGSEEKPATNTPAAAEVGVELKSAQPQNPRGTAPQFEMLLHNNGTDTCKLPSSAVGSVDVVSVTRDGQAVVGAAGHAYYYSGMADVIESSLRDVALGATATAPLDIGALPNSPVLLTVSRQTDADDGSLTSWPLDQPGQYDVKIDAVGDDADYLFTAKAS